MSFHKAFIGALVIGTLAACGSGGGSASSAASAAASAASNAAGAAQSAASSAGGAMSNAAQGAGNAMSNAAGAMTGAIPNCGAVKAVWVNTKTHKYHESTDPMYGKTKHGKYMCPSAAKAEGDTPAGGGMTHHKKG